MKIALVIPGRFHGFDLARALIARGHEVTVFTNYPHWATRRFGLPDRAVRSCVGHGVLARVVDRMPGRAAWTAAEPTMHQMLGRWAARELAREEWDIIHCWSGISEELLRSPAVRRRATLLMRCSSHIETQSRLLLEEEQRSGIALDRPTPWVIGRETREYALADHILVLSTFSRQSFLDQGVPEDRVTAVPPGLDLSAFRPTEDLVNTRSDRIQRGEALKAVFVGAVSLRKGLLDLEVAIEHLAGGPFEFTFVGPVLPECAALARRLAGKAHFVGKVPQDALPQHYAEADLFVFPTIEDGFPYVLAQARASGLPIVTTLHGAGTDIVTDGHDGWIVPVRDPAALAACLRRLAADRSALAAMADRVAGDFEPQGWQIAAEQFEQVCASLLAGARHLETT